MMVVEYIRCNLTNTKTAVEPPPNAAMITASGERGRLDVETYTPATRIVLLVPVNGKTLPVTTQTVEDSLNRFYRQAAMTWKVSLRTNGVNISGWDTHLLDDGDNAMMSKYTTDMQALIQAYKDSYGDPGADTSLLFICGSPASGSKQGYMPIKGRFGFLFADKLTATNAPRTAAHELGHGVFRLWHTFSTQNKYLFAQGTTPNLMDYNNDSTELFKYQWDYVHDPESVTFAWTQDEAEGANKIPEAMFSEADEAHNIYGYDESNSSSTSTSERYICVKEYAVTYVRVILSNIKSFDNISFTSDDPLLKLILPTKFSKDFYIGIDATSLGSSNTVINVDAKYINTVDNTANLLDNVKVYVFKEKNVGLNVYYYGSPLDVESIQTNSNKLLKNAVVKLSIISTEQLTNDYDNNKNGKLDYYININPYSPLNDELAEIFNYTTKSNAIVVLENGFNISMRIKSTVSIGDVELNVPSVVGFNKSCWYKIINPVTFDEEYFYIEEIDKVNLKIKVRLAVFVGDADRPQAVSSESNGFKKSYVINNTVNDPYIYRFSPGGISGKIPILSKDDLFVTIPHECFHSYDGLSDVDITQNNIMNCNHTVGTTPSKPLRFFNIQPVKTGCGIPEGTEQSQWLLIKR